MKWARGFLLCLCWGVFCSAAWGYTEDQGEPPVLRIVTLNIFAGTHGIDMDRLARQIAEVQRLNPDVIALQEVYDRRAQEAYRQAFPQFFAFDSASDFLARPFLRGALRITQSLFEAARSVLGVAQWAPGSREFLEGDSHGLMILLNRERGFTAENTRFVRVFQVQAGPSLKTRFIEWFKPRALLAVETSLRGARILFLNSHLSNGVSNDRRFHQLEEIIERLEIHDIDRPGQRCAAVFCGDTNADGREPEMEWFHARGGGGFVDTFAAANPGIRENPRLGDTWREENTLTRGHLIEPDQRLDYISVRDGATHRVEVVRSELVLNSPAHSDHYGVMTEVRLHRICQTLLTR